MEKQKSIFVVDGFVWKLLTIAQARKLILLNEPVFAVHAIYNDGTEELVGSYKYFKKLLKDVPDIKFGIEVGHLEEAEYQNDIMPKRVSKVQYTGYKNMMLETKAMFKYPCPNHDNNDTDYTEEILP